MIIHIEICDVCKQLTHGLPMQSFSTADGAWDVGACCRNEPFTVVRDANVTKLHLLTRIAALIATELKLLKEPA